MRMIFFGCGIAGIVLTGAVHAAIGLPVSQESLYEPLRMEAVSTMRLAELLLLDEDVLPDQEEDTTGEVSDQDTVKRAKQDTPPEGGNKQTKQIGEVTDSKVTGQIRTRGVVDDLHQSQAGRANVQKLGVGAVKDSHVVGNVDINVHLEHGNQNQVGESNQQGISLGDLR